MGKKILEEIKSLGIKLNEIKKILITHSDVDHVGSLNYLAKKIKCPVYISKDEYDNYLKKSKESMKKMFNPIKAFLINNFVKMDKKKLSVIKNDKVGEFKVIKTPSKFHSYGMVMFLYNKNLFCGDMIQTSKGAFMPIPENYNLDNKIYFSFLKKINMKEVEYIFNAHGKPLQAHPA
jgi:glyoxylase-like metal-dependent hydrolase (beta-lactamase superfamily II)